MFVVIFFSMMVAVSAKCVYKHDIPKNLKLSDDPSVVTKDIFGLFPIEPMNSIEECVNYCSGQPWCFATGDSPPGVAGACQFYTDFAALGFRQPGHYDCSHNINFNCEFDDNYLLDLGGAVFGFVHFDKNILIPTDIIDGDDGGFCRRLKTVRNENAHSPNTSHVYSRYYGTTPVTPRAWAFHYYDADSDTTDEAAGNPGLYATNGVNDAQRGFPIKSIGYWEVDIKQDTKFNFTDRSRFVYFRNEYIHASKCADTGTSAKYVDREAIKSEKTYFYIKMGGDKYLNCRLDRDEAGNGCTWDDTPTVMWTFGDFVQRGSDTIADRRFGADNTLIAHHVDTGEEIGWLMGDMATFEEDTPPGTIGLVPRGAARGTGTWNFFIGANINDIDTLFPQEPMHGTSLCFTAKYVDIHTTKHAMMCVKQNEGSNIASAAQINADLTLDSTIVPNRTEALLHATNTGFNYNRNYCFKDGTMQGADNITVVHVDNNFDGHLFEIVNSNGLKLKCVLGKKCKWVTNSTQLFKFNFNGQSDSSDTMDFIDFIPSRRGEVIVYETDGSFYVRVGMLIDLTVVSQTKMTDDVGVFKRDGTFCTLSATDGVMCLKGGNDIEEGDEATMASPSNNHVQFIPQIDKLVVSDEDYQWVLDGSGQCPPGFYVHQIRCTDEKLCHRVEVGCRRDNPQCSLGTTNTEKTLEHSLFNTCPDGTVVTAVNVMNNVMNNASSHTITCTDITITPDDAPSSDVFPSFTNLGVVIAPADVPFDGTNARIKKWPGAVPLKALSVGESFTTPMVYGQKCFRDRAETSAFKQPGQPAFALNTPSDTPRMCRDNKFISFIRCTDGNDCGKGLEFFCDDAPQCRYDGDDTVTVTGSVPTCPFGTAVVGLACDNILSQDRPCSILKITCRRIVFDSSIPPSPPSDSGGDTKREIKTIIISLSVGLPLLIVCAIVCLFCIPDVEDTDENRVRASKEGTQTSAEIEMTSRGVIRRRVGRRNNMF